jgi:hypothetical protein
MTPAGAGSLHSPVFQSPKPGKRGAEADNDEGRTVAGTITEQQIKVRKVTHWQPSFTAKEPGEDGVYTFQLVLDHGADEAILRVNDDDADNLFDWLAASDEVYFDLDRRVLMFGTRPVGS